MRTLQYETPTGEAATIASKFRILLMRVDKFNAYNFDGEEYPNAAFEHWLRKDGLCKQCNVACGAGHCFFCYGQVRRASF